MSASETTSVGHAGTPQHAGQDQHARADDVGPAGVQPGQVEPLGRGHRQEPLDERVHVVDGELRLVDQRAGRTPPGRARRRRPRSPCRRRRRRWRPRASGTGDRSRWASMSATQAATSSAVGGSECRCRSCRRTEPMSSDTAACGPSAVGAQDQLGRPAADVDDEDRLGGRRPEVAHRAVEGQGRLLVTRHDLGLDAEPRADTGDEDVGVLGVPAGRGRAEPDPARRRARRSARRTRRARRTSAPAPRRARRPVASTPWPSRTIRISRTVHVREVADEELDRVGAAVDRCYTHGTGLPPVAEQVEHLVAQRVHAATLGQRLAGEHVQALHPVRHAAGGDPVDLGDVLAGGTAELGAVLEVALVRGRRTRPPGPGPRPAAPPSPSSGPTPRASRSGRRRGGRSGRRWSGTACRRQPRQRRDDVRVAAGAAVPDLVDRAGFAAELGGDGCLVGGVDGHR